MCVYVCDFILFYAIFPFNRKINEGIKLWSEELNVIVQDKQIIGWLFVIFFATSAHYKETTILFIEIKILISFSLIF